MLFCQFHNRVHIRILTEEMHRNNRLCAFCNQSLSLISRDAEVIRVPFDYDFTTLEYDGVYVSNGPGCPCACEKTIENIKKAFESGKPVFGLGLGYLLVAKAAGCELERLAHPHRGANQPVRKEGTNRTYITSQNVYTGSETSIIVEISSGNFN